MKDVISLIFHLLTTMAKLLQPGGSRAIIAENLLLKQQLIIHSRSRQRAPNLSVQDRALLGFWALYLNHRRIARSAIILKPSTELRFHAALKKRKYRQLYSPCGGGKFIGADDGDCALPRTGFPEPACQLTGAIFQFR